MPQILRIQNGETTSQTILGDQRELVAAQVPGIAALSGYPLQEFCRQVVYLDSKWQFQSPNSVSVRVSDRKLEMTPACINLSETKFFHDRLAALEAGVESSVMFYKHLVGNIAGAGAVVLSNNLNSAIDATVEPKPNSNQVFFNTLDEHLRRNRIQKAVNFVLFELDELLESEKFEKCDEILSQVDVTKIPIALMISILGITRPYKDSLPYRPDLFQKVEIEILKVKSETEKANLIERLK